MDSLPMKPAKQTRIGNNNKRSLSSPAENNGNINQEGKKSKTEKRRMRKELKKKGDTERKLEADERQRQIDEESMEEEKKREDAKKRELISHLKAVVQAFTGAQDVYIHLVDSNCLEYVSKLKDLERKNCAPLDSHMPDFPKEQTTFIHESGLHVGYDRATQSVVFQAKITPWTEMNPSRFNKVTESIDTLMDYTKVANSINNNGSQHLKHEKGSTELPGKKFGKMFAAGWHAPLGEQETEIGYYSWKRQSEKQQNVYSQCVTDLSAVHDAYSEGLRSMYPMEHQAMLDVAARTGIPDFSQTEIDEENTIMPALANSITITCNDFSNYLHTDRDESHIAYGWWWIGSRKNRLGRWELDIDNHNHSDVKGGAFLIGQYGYAVDFER
ncbi:hypothetical protein VKT23_013938 [Stygiomarasmius scandens]|uniref:Tet-like 2OG-Fe(II) oxygenase domain-containing protein n=1 Tax=Marasmiellus scandens TaxID=2682957 RepID=A0ABR1J6I6_9AGAR